jgi:hypothetical protein
MRLSILVPAYESWTTDFGYSLALTMGRLPKIPGIDSVKLTRCDGTGIHEGRMALAEQALKDGSTHALWLDSDMKFKPEHVIAILSVDQPFVAATYRKRRPPHEWIAQDLHGNRIEASDDDHLIAARHAGFGFCVTKMEIFQQVPKPWFASPWVAESEAFMSEDVWFCNHARAHGIACLVSPLISKGIGHVGKEIF